MSPALRSIPRRAACLPLLAVLSIARPAAADDPKPVEITIAPKGQPWAIGPRGGAECAPTCKLHLAPDKYLVTIGGAKEELLLDGPTQITYSPGSPRMRTVGGWMAIGGIGSGGFCLGLGIYGYTKSCLSSQGCPGFTLSNTAKGALVIAAAGLISVSVTGAILYAVSGESIRARDLPRGKPVARRSFDVTLNPSSYGATIGFVKQF